MIVLIEKSTAEFHKMEEHYLHRFCQKSDTGLKVELLQTYLLIPLDIFKQIIHNRGVRNKLEAWLAFFSMDEPEMILELIQAYPEFKKLYQHVYDICMNVENVMGIFSEELAMLDRNTTLYMIKEMENQIREQKAQLNQKEEQLNQKDQRIKLLEKQLKELKDNRR